MNTNKEVEWRRFIVPKKVEQINDHLFIDTYKWHEYYGQSSDMLNNTVSISNT